MSFSLIPVILRKNILLAKDKLSTIIWETFINLLITIPLVLMIISQEAITSKTYDEFCPAMFEGSKCTSGNEETLLKNSKKWFLAYSPRNPIIDASMEAIGRTLQKNASGFQNSKELANYFLTEDRKKTLAGIEFDDNLAGKDELPPELTIKLRFPSEMQSSPKSGLGLWNTDESYQIPPEDRAMQLAKENEDALPYYSKEGFLGLQQLVTYFLILVQQNKTSENSISDFNRMPKITMEKFPQIKFRMVQFTDDLIRALVALLIYMFASSSFCDLVMSEKQGNIEEVLKINNVPAWVHLTGWIIFGMLRLSVFGAVIYILFMIKLEGEAVCENSDKLYLLLIILLIVLLHVVFMLLVTACVSSALKATLFYFGGLFLQIIIYTKLYSENLICIIGVSLLPVTCSCFLLQHVIVLERKTLGLNWEYTWKVVNKNKNTLGISLMMALLDVILFIILYLYLEAVLPKEFGSYRPWNFLCMKPTSSSDEVTDDTGDPATSEEATSSSKIPKYIEDDPRNLQVGVEVKRLRKVFKVNVAVKDISFKMFENQVTALLGPNGAGKSTLISMVVGLLKPTSGTAIVNGYNIETQLIQARKFIGICPQFNPLYDSITVQEHLNLYCNLRRSRNTKDEIEHYLQAMNLVDKRHAKTKSLSGGMKRRLCVALAFCGGTKIVFLDEPTAGVDPTMRRDIWDLIIREKPGRTILLTTHFMDEADLLGDRIVIIAEGEMRCAGTGFFLKKRYGTGYQLVIEKAQDCNPGAITSLLGDYIRGIKIQANLGTKLTYILPEEHLNVFPDMMGALENNLGNLKIKSFGIELATLEEVFLRAGSGEDVKVIKAGPKRTGGSDRRKNLLTGGALVKQQILAMLVKRWLTTSISTLIIILAPPLALLIAALIVSRSKVIIDDQPAWKFSLNNYEEATVLLEQNTSNKIFDASFRNVILANGGTIKEVSDVRSFIRDKSKHAPLHDFEYVFGANFHTESDNSTKVKLWFNNFYFHTPGLGMQLVLDSIYKQEMGTDHQIQFINHPLKLEPETKKIMMEAQGVTKTQNRIPNWIAYVPFAYCLLCIPYVVEIVNKSKHLQLSLGTNIFIFWLTPHIVDLIICLLSVILIVIIVACFKIPGFKTPRDLGFLVFILMLFCAAFLTRTYLLSLIGTNPAQTVCILMFLVFMEVWILPFVMIFIPAKAVDVVQNPLIILLNVYGLNVALSRMQAYESMNTMCSQYVDECVENGGSKKQCRELISALLERCSSSVDIMSTTKDGIGYCIIGWVATLAAGWLLIVLIERGSLYIICDFLCLSCISPKEDVPVTLDEEVIEEKFRIKNTPQEELISNNAVVLESVSKRFCKLMAVRDISLAIQGNECFGLLGTNGAGKTTLFKILTGDIKRFKGKGWTHGYSINNEKSKVRRHISYCPQFDALPERLTVRQTLKMFCLIRGVKLKDCKDVSDKLAKDFDFEKHMDKKIARLSGGNKRKVSSAVAMVGDPDIIYMDEPTTGMDVSTRRHLWNRIIAAYGSGKCVVLTTHSMEESEALCTKVAIMLNGQIIALGSIQYLKNKYVKGCTITVNVKKDADSRPIESFMKNNFPKSKFVERHQDLLKFILEEKVQWSQMFRIMQKAKNDKVLEDYTIAQPSLEDVFLNLTREQRS